MLLQLTCQEHFMNISLKNYRQLQVLVYLSGINPVCNSTQLSRLLDVLEQLIHEASIDSGVL